MQVKITRRITVRRAGQPRQLQEEKELQIGQYHEYYWPALHQMSDAEMWIIVEVDGVETKIHFKR